MPPFARITPTSHLEPAQHADPPWLADCAADASGEDPNRLWELALERIAEARVACDALPRMRDLEEELMAWFAVEIALTECTQAAEELRRRGMLDADSVDVLTSLCEDAAGSRWGTCCGGPVPKDLADLIADALLGRPLTADQVGYLSQVLGEDPLGGRRAFVVFQELSA